MLQLSVVSPERKVLESQCRQITVPTKMGLITILPSHAPLFSILSMGEVEIRDENGKSNFLLVSGGFVSVHQNQVTLLTDFGIRDDELDEKLIMEAKQRAEQEMKDKTSPQELEKARADFLHVSMQMEFLKRRKHLHAPRTNPDQE